MNFEPTKLHGRDAQPDISIYAGDSLKWDIHGARCQVKHLSAQIRLAIGMTRRPHTPEDWIEQDRAYITKVWPIRRSAQADVRRFERLLAERDAPRLAAE